MHERSNLEHGASRPGLPRGRMAANGCNPLWSVTFGWRMAGACASMSATTPLALRIGVDEAAGLFGISPKTLCHGIAYGWPHIRLRSAKIGGRRAFRLSAVEHCVGQWYGEAPEWRFDSDDQEGVDAGRRAGLPPPRLVMVNPAKGYSHAAWSLAASVRTHPARRDAPLRYARAMRRALKQFRDMSEG